MARVLGFKVEATEGTSPLTTPASDEVTRFGIHDYETPQPWHDQEFHAIAQIDHLEPQDIIAGVVNCVIKLRYDVVHAEQYKRALGKVAGAGPYTMTPGTTSWKSYTLYFEEADDIVEAVGCFVKQLDIYIEGGKKGKPVYVDETWWGWKTEEGTKITTSTSPKWPASLNSTRGHGFSNVSEVEYNDVDQLTDVEYIHVSIVNHLVRKYAMNNTVPVGIEREGTSVLCDFRCYFNGTANDLWAKCKAGAITLGATNDLEARYTWNTSYYHDIHVHNLQLFKPVAVKPKPPVGTEEAQPMMYTCAGIAVDDGTNEMITITANDGASYS